MKIFITGGTGLIGRAVTSRLLARGDEVEVLTRHPARARKRLPAGVTMIEGDPNLRGSWQEELAVCDAVVNLAGESIASGRWTEKKKRALRQSRLATTGHVVEAVGRSDTCRVLVSASAVGYYGDRGAEALTESHEPGRGFLARLTHEWEQAAAAAEDQDRRVVRVRMGVVLAREGGALPRMLPAYRLGLGGRLGSGQQYFPWIHIDDAAGICLFALDRDDLRGPVNAVAPDPPTQAAFARALCARLGRPCIMRVPGFLLQLAVGELASGLLASERAVPNALKAAGYRFEHGDLREALADLGL
ncbi:MAG: TIGR01777 family oxidoreductase [Candidatus Krumholzibacteriia bacterium]